MSDEFDLTFQAMMDDFDWGTFEQDPAAAVEKFFAQLSLEALSEIILYVSSTLAQNAERQAGLKRDLSHLRRAMERVIRNIPGAETLDDVLTFLARTPNVEQSPEYDLFRLLADKLIESEETSFTSEGRLWCEHEVEYFMVAHVGTLTGER